MRPMRTRLALALDEGLLRLDDPVCRHPTMTLHDLASFTAGLAKRSGTSCSDPLLFEPGTDYAYGDGSANRVRDAVQVAYGVDLVGLELLLEERLFAPIGVTS